MGLWPVVRKTATVAAAVVGVLVLGVIAVLGAWLGIAAALISWAYFSTM